MFLGCTVPARARHYEMSARRVAEIFDLTFADIPEFTCCGFPLKSTDQELSLLMSAANLALAQREGMDICALCSACTALLAEADHQIQGNTQLKSWVNKHLSAAGLRIDGPVKVRHFSRVLYEEIGLSRLKAKIVQPLDGFSLAPHYGCHYLKPSEIHGGFDDVERPVSLAQLIEITGATVTDLDDRKDCCGGAVLAVEPEITYSMAAVKLNRLKEKAADAMVLICPFCAVVYDTNQRAVESHENTAYQLPVLYYPQVLGLAMGLNPKVLGLKLNAVKTKELLQQIEEASSQ